jgi:hypothetical protein
MCYTRKDRDLKREARRITERRLMEEEARHRHEERIPGTVCRFNRYDERCRW